MHPFHKGRRGLAFVAAMVAGASAWADVTINEIRIDQTGTDNDEYFELAGPASTSLNDLTYIVLGDGAGGSGVIETVVSLAGRSIASDGYFAVVESTFTLSGADFTAAGANPLNFENTDNLTHLLVSGFSGTNGQDLDTNDDGVLDVTPWSAIVDSVAVVKSTNFPTEDRFYSATTVGPDGSAAPFHVLRLPNATGPWQIGSTDIAGGDDTPGAANFLAGIGPATDRTIREIQGAAHTSPFADTRVRTTGIVTAVDSNGFYIQDPTPDANVATSEGIFVFTSAAPTVVLGDSVEVEGSAVEFTPGGIATGNLSITEITGPALAITILSSGNALPAPVLIGTGGRTPPTQVIEDDNFAVFDAANDGIDFYESLEGMRVTVASPVAIAPTNNFGEIWVLADSGSGATGSNLRGGITITETDYNPERIQVQVGPDGLVPAFAPQVDVGDQLADVTGVVSYNFGNFEVQVTQSFTVTPGTLAPEVSNLVGTVGEVTIAGANMLNLDPNDLDGNADIADGQFERLAEMIVTALRSPDVVALQEIQDNSGSTNNGVVDADLTLSTLVDAIVLAGGPEYEFIDYPPVNNQDGGEPGGNIRVAYLYNTARVSLVPGSVQRITDTNLGDGDAFASSRKPLLAEFAFRGKRFTVINNHFTSKGGGTPLFGRTQPSVNGGLDSRIAQATVVREVVDGLQAQDPLVNVLVIGDLNEFEFNEPLTILEGSGTGELTDLALALPELERYSYIFEGNSQALDHVLVSQTLASIAEYDIVHVNTEFTDGASDHDPDLVRVRLPSQPDLDCDGLSDAREGVLGTSPSLRDTDGDGIHDGVEVEIGTSPLAAGPSPDTDGDGIPDAFDAHPANPDRDGDSIGDGYELVRSGSTNAGTPTNPSTPLGDANGTGGKPTTTDAQLLLKIVLGQSVVPAGVDPSDLDVNCDGAVDRADSTLLLFFALRRVAYLPQP